MNRIEPVKDLYKFDQYYINSMRFLYSSSWKISLAILPSGVILFRNIPEAQRACFVCRNHKIFVECPVSNKLENTTPNIKNRKLLKS
jgi:hypothetical protein